MGPLLCDWTPTQLFACKLDEFRCKKTDPGSANKRGADLFYSVSDIL